MKVWGILVLASLFLGACENSSSVNAEDSSSSVFASETESSSSWIASNSSSSWQALSSANRSDMSSSSVIAQSSSSSSSGIASETRQSVEPASPCNMDGVNLCEFGTLKDSRDGKTYKTISIGNQVWMAENLNYAYLAPTPQLDSSSFCREDLCETYGRFYIWSAAMDSSALFSQNGKGCGDEHVCSPVFPVRGVCPEGWHLPRIEEFEVLFTAVGGDSIAGNMLKSTSGWNDFEIENGNGSDAFGFSALPAGYIGNPLSYNAIFWTSSDTSDLSAQIAYFRYNVSVGMLEYSYKYYARTVRCVKN